MNTWFLWRDLKERNRFEDVGVKWNDNIETDLQVVRLGGMDWIDLSHDRDRWRDFVNAVMNLRVL